MMKEQVIITKVNIKLQGERKHFQIKLPKDTKYIIGVEYGGRLLTKSDGPVVKPAPKEAPKVEAIQDVHVHLEATSSGKESRTLFKRNQLIGELKLQSCEEANWFYATDVFANDANLDYADFSKSGFPINDFTHGNKKTEEIVKVDAESTIIQGWYLDALGKSQKMDIQYEVTVYVWINVEE